jgi:hypothetical protein
MVSLLDKEVRLLEACHQAFENSVCKTKQVGSYILDVIAHAPSSCHFHWTVVYEADLKAIWTSQTQLNTQKRVA